MSRLLFRLMMAFLFGGFLLMVSDWFYTEKPQPLQPLKVTIIDSGGADLKVESTVVPEKRQ